MKGRTQEVQFDKRSSHAQTGLDAGLQLDLLYPVLTAVCLLVPS